MNRVRKQRLIMVVVIVVGVASAAALTLYALGENVNLFYTPSEIMAGKAPEGRRIRAGGLVVQGSVERDPDSARVRFKITDKASQMPVRYQGILPDLFREGQGIVADGHWTAKGVFRAEEVLAKHDETYKAPEVKQALKEAGHPAQPQGEEKSSRYRAQ